MNTQTKSNKLFFVPLNNYKHGLIFDLLSKSYSDLLENYVLNHKNDMIDNWKKFDNEAFDNLETIGRCVFLTRLGEKVIGFGSFDPRQWPEIGVIGHNCILPEYRGHGYGKMQILEIIKRFRKRKFKKARVSTGDHPFFLSSQKMYLACGFTETRKFKNNKTDFPEIEYELNL